MTSVLEVLHKIKDRNNTTREVTFGRMSFIPLQKRWSGRCVLNSLKISVNHSKESSAFTPIMKKREELVLKSLEGTPKTPKSPLRKQVALCVCVQCCPTLCDSMDYSLPSSSVHGILQVRILEWVVISFFRESSQPRDQTGISCIEVDSLPLSHMGSP